MFTYARPARALPLSATAKVLSSWWANVGELRQLSPALIVLEATGGFEITVAAALASAGLPLAVVNPRQIRDFARATGRLAKTGALEPTPLPCLLNAYVPNHARSPMPTARAWPN